MINHFKCDYCNKIHKVPIKAMTLLRVRLMARVGTKDFDFCNEDCLRDFIINRKPNARF